MKRVMMKANKDEPEQVEFVDADTGEILEDVRGAHLMIRAGQPSILTLEMLAVDNMLETGIIEAELVDSPQAPEKLRDKKGRLWLNAQELAREIRAEGTLCSRGRKTFVAHDFSDERLKVWESIETGPLEGQKKGDQNNG